MHCDCLSHTVGQSQRILHCRCEPVCYIGVGSLPYFSDDDEDSGDSSSQDDKSEGEESEDNDADFSGLMEDQLERRTSTSKIFFFFFFFLCGMHKTQTSVSRVDDS